MFYKNLLLLAFTLFLGSCGTEKSQSSLMVHTAYGDFNVTEPVLIELFKSPALERLKGVRQYGTLDYVMNDPHYSRYEHSVGVWALLRHYGATIQEQIAGLLHDASHTVFSHVGDHVYNTPETKNSYQDGIHTWYLEQQGIDKILKPYGMTLQDIDHKSPKFTRLEQNLPDMCMDRIEYNLKAAVLTGFIEEHEIKIFVDDLNFDEPTQRWYFKTTALAKRFAIVPMYNSLHVWGGPESFMINTLSARILKRAMECGVITEHEVHFSTDDVVWEKLCASNDSVIQETLHTLKHYQNSFVPSSSDVCHYTIHTKFRGFNPWVKTADGFARLTEIDQEFCDTYNGVKQTIAQGWPIRWTNGSLIG